MANVTTLQVTKGTSVTVFASFTIATRTSAKNGLSAITYIAADPALVEVVWAPKGKTKNTWTVGGGEVTKLQTGLYVWTIPTTTGNQVTGTVYGKTGGCTATGQWSIPVKALVIS